MNNLLPKELLDQHNYLDGYSILLAYRGSIAHGMYIGGQDSIDDKDLMAVVVPPIDYYFGLKEFGSRGTKEVFHNEWDIVTYELKKFVSLLTKGNPNVISMLWLNPKHYIKITPEGQMLIDNRELFISKQIYHSFVGYAYSQLHKMEHLAFKGYMGEKRKQLVQKFGYDTKNAAHLIRLLTMAVELLRDNTFIVERPDAKMLLDIKQGHWTLEQVKSSATSLFKEAKDLFDKSNLPDHPDMESINHLLCIILQDRMGYE